MLSNADKSFDFKSLFDILLVDLESKVCNCWSSSTLFIILTFNLSNVKLSNSLRKLLTNIGLVVVLYDLR